MSTFNPGTYQSGDGNLSEPILVGRLGQPLKLGGGSEFSNYGSGPISDRPIASVFGKGSWNDGLLEYKSDGVRWRQTNPVLRENTIAIIGDSFDVRSEVIVGADYKTNLYGLWHQINFRLMGKLDFVYIDGISGSGALAGSVYSDRIDAAIAAGAKYVALRASVNDFTVLQDYATLLAAYNELFTKINNAGMTIISNTVGGNNAYDSAEKRNNWMRFNKYMLAEAPKEFDIIVLQQHWQTLDHAALTGALDSAMSIDGSHPAPKGAFTIAKTSSDQLDPIFANVESPLSAIAAVGLTENAIDTNPINVGIGGTLAANVTGEVSDLYGVRAASGAGTVVASKVARTDGPGAWQQCVWTPSAANQQLDYYLLGVGTSLTTAGASIGDIIQGFAEVEMDVATAEADVHYSGLKITFRNGGGSTIGFYFDSTQPALAIAGPWRGVVSTPKMPIPVGTTEIQITMMWMNKTTGVQTIRFGQHGVVNHSR